jgi:hypothetical protein
MYFTQVQVLMIPFSENLCVLNRMPISIPTIPDDAELLRFNYLFAHLLKALAGSQGMSSYDINPSIASKGITNDSPSIASTTPKFASSHQPKTSVRHILLSVCSRTSMPS